MFIGCDFLGVLNTEARNEGALLKNIETTSKLNKHEIIFITYANYNVR